jgi:hypothetical protein
MGEHHLLCDEHGGVPVDLNEWERQVLYKEMDTQALWRGGRTLRGRRRIRWPSPIRTNQDRLGARQL